MWNVANRYSGANPTKEAFAGARKRLDLEIFHGNLQVLRFHAVLFDLKEEGPTGQDRQVL